MAAKPKDKRPSSGNYQNKGSTQRNNLSNTYDPVPGPSLPPGELVKITSVTMVTDRSDKAWNDKSNKDRAHMSSKKKDSPRTITQRLPSDPPIVPLNIANAPGIKPLSASNGAMQEWNNNNGTTATTVNTIPPRASSTPSISIPSRTTPYLHPNHRQRSTSTTPPNAVVLNSTPPSVIVLPTLEPPKAERVRRSQPKEPSPHPEIYDLEAARGRLTRAQTSRLKSLLDEEYNIVSKDGMIRATISPLKLIEKLILRLAEKNIHCLPTGIRLVGSGAAHALMESDVSANGRTSSQTRNGEMGFYNGAGPVEHPINDIDFCFYVPETVKFLEILQIEEKVICDLIEESAGQTFNMIEVYNKFFLDSVKVEVEAEESKESWSLITIGEQGLRTIDIKFVIKSRRSWVFSADSFEIVLDALFSQVISRSNGKGKGKSPRKVVTNTEEDTEEGVVIVESLYADYAEALDHLRNKRLYTKRPQEIRRGIFRYCHELAKGKTPASEEERTKLDKIFVESFLLETNSDFEGVLKKFLMKHTSSSLSCLDQLHAIFQRSGIYNKTEDYLNIIATYRNRYESLTHTFPGTTENNV